MLGCCHGPGLTSLRRAWWGTCVQPQIRRLKSSGPAPGDPGYGHPRLRAPPSRASRPPARDFSADAAQDAVILPVQDLAAPRGPPAVPRGRPGTPAGPACCRPVLPAAGQAAPLARHGGRRPRRPGAGCCSPPCSSGPSATCISAGPRRPGGGCLPCSSWPPCCSARARSASRWPAARPRPCTPAAAPGPGPAGRPPRPPSGPPRRPGRPRPAGSRGRCPRTRSCPATRRCARCCRPRGSRPRGSSRSAAAIPPRWAAT